MLSMSCNCIPQIKLYIYKKRKNTKIIEVVGGQWVAIRSTYRIGRGLSAAAADDFCDCPKMAYLGTGCGEKRKKLGLATASQHRLLKQSPWGGGGFGFLNPLYIDAP